MSARRHRDPPDPVRVALYLDDVEVALRAFQADESYAVAMARAANILQAKRSRTKRTG